MTSFRRIAALSALSLSLVLASTAAFAGEKGAGGKAFPVAGAEYKQHIEARLEKKRTKLEAKIANKKLPDAKAAEMRTRFEGRRVKITAAVDKAVADGTVTKEEAQEVRKVGHEGRKHRKGKGKKGQAA